ncbi:hypothetical protein [Vibrio breoganii]|uniref:hypothetical protein n=1 Tax=Vibrio breoganii TaxID=553239 RepID=UPI0010BD7969|nr:hypothetical protein [Vibrio breoganii]TKG23075.1 hypothetical protein FCV81_06995 [Vibrio breoganii]
MFDNIYPQMPSGHVMHLFQFSDSDLLKWEYIDNIGKPVGMKQDKLCITMDYDPPKGILNWVLKLPWSLRGKKRYQEIYEFYPYMVEGDLPPGEYA